MDFPQYAFEYLNEPDIREEIVAPLLRHRGLFLLVKWARAENIPNDTGTSGRSDLPM
jgi:hypothetical protein